MLEVRHLTIVQGGRRLWDSVSFSVNLGELHGISAPSGYGKTTLGRVLAQWQTAASGSVTVGGQPLSPTGYCPIQLVPQHPEQTFNPYRTTGESLRDAWSPDAGWLARLAVNPAWLARRPDELSGGELARIALLRALDPHALLDCRRGDCTTGCPYSGAGLESVAGRGQASGAGDDCVQP